MALVYSVYPSQAKTLYSPCVVLGDTIYVIVSLIDEDDDDSQEGHFIRLLCNKIGEDNVSINFDKVR